MGLEYANIGINIGILIGIVGLMLFFLRRLDRMKDEIKADMVKMEAGMEKMEAGMEKMETGIRADMKDMEVRIIADVNIKHGEVREDLRDIRVGLVEVREGQARLEGIVEGMGRVAEPVASAD